MPRFYIALPDPAQARGPEPAFSFSGNRPFTAQASLSPSKGKKRAGRRRAAGSAAGTETGTAETDAPATPEQP